MNLPDCSRAGFADLWRGASLPFRALGLICSTPRLRLWAAGMGAVTLLLLAALAVGAFQGAPALVEALWTKPEAWYAVAAHTLLKVLTFALLFVIGANVLPPLAMVPLTDPLSVETERALGVAPEEASGLGRMVRETTRSLANMVQRIAIFLLGHAVLLPLNLVPGVGNLAWSICGWIWTAYWIALSNLDIPMARHLYTFRHALAALQKRRRLLFGFGATLSLLLWIPLLNALFLPVSIVAATLLFRCLVAAGVLPSPAAVALSKGDPAALSKKQTSA